MENRRKEFRKTKLRWMPVNMLWNISLLVIAYIVLSIVAPELGFKLIIAISVLLYSLKVDIDCTEDAAIEQLENLEKHVRQNFLPNRMNQP